MSGVGEVGLMGTIPRTGALLMPMLLSEKVPVMPVTSRPCEYLGSVAVPLVIERDPLVPAPAKLTWTVSACARADQSASNRGAAATKSLCFT